MTNYNYLYNFFFIFANIYRHNNNSYVANEMQKKSNAKKKNRVLIIFDECD